MTRDDIERAFSEFCRRGRRPVIIMLGSLLVCFGIVFVRRYALIGAFAYPQPETDYFALVLFTLWLLFFTPWLAMWETRNLRKHGLCCPSCQKLWRLRFRKKLLDSGSCPYCHSKVDELFRP